MIGYAAKAITAFVTLIGTWLTTVLEDGSISGHEWYGVIPVIAGTLAVFAIPNKPPPESPVVD